MKSILFSAALLFSAAHKHNDEKPKFNFMEQCSPEIDLCKTQVRQTMHTKHQQFACFQDAMTICKTSDLHGENLFMAITDCLRVKQGSVSALCMEWMNTLPKLVVSPTLVVADPTLVVADPTLVIADPTLVPEDNSIEKELVEGPLSRKPVLQSNSHERGSPSAERGSKHHGRRHGHGGEMFANQIGQCLQDHQQEFPADCQAAVAEVVANGDDWSFLLSDDDDGNDWKIANKIFHVAVVVIIFFCAIKCVRKCCKKCKNRRDAFPSSAIGSINTINEPLVRGAVDSSEDPELQRALALSATPYTGTGRIHNGVVGEYI